VGPAGGRGDTGWDDDRVRALRLDAQGLTGPRSTTVEAVVDRLLAVQAQDERGFRLAIRSRSTGLTATDVEAALGDRRLVVTWLNRGTLHLVRSDDYRWLHQLTAPRVIAGVERRLRQLGVGVTAEARGVATVVGALESEGPLNRHQLRARLDQEGVPAEGQALVHLLAMASLRGLVVRGPMVDGSHAFVSVGDWLGPAMEAVDRPTALARLAGRYVEGHGPATPKDLAAWAGVTLGDARLGFAEWGGELQETPAGFVTDPSRSVAAPSEGDRLLGPFDPLLHGWQNRDLFVGAHRSVVTTNGIFRAVCLVDGRVVGTWTLPSGDVQIELLETVGETGLTGLTEDAADVLRYLGLGHRPPRVRGPEGTELRL
jgi:Winged helix DNA-binding domain